MGRRAEISLATRSAIITLHNEGKKLREFASQLEVSLKGVYSTIERYKSTGSLEDRKRTGRPKTTTSAKDQHIIVTSKRNRRLTAPEIRVEVNRSRSKPVSLTTVKRRLRAAGLKGCIATKKLLLSP